MALSENLCNLMKTSGVSSYKLSKLVGVTTSTVTGWRTGRVPQLKHLISIADVFGVTVEELAGTENQEKVG